MKKILLFAGTSEGKELIRFLSSSTVQTDICVATDYGANSIEPNEKIKIRKGRLNAQDMIELIRKERYDMVIDATHPYAVEVSRNIKQACEKTDTNRLRVARESTETNDCIKVSAIPEAVAYLNQREGNILLTTGVKDLKTFTSIDHYEKRVFPRILPMIDGLDRCIQLGFSPKNVICMHGPFSAELNIAMIRHFNIRCLVTKDTGQVGGFPEKLLAAKQTDTEAIVIARPYAQTGMTVAQAIMYIDSILT